MVGVSKGLYNANGDGIWNISFSIDIIFSNERFTNVMVADLDYIIF